MPAWVEGSWADGAWEDDSWVGMGDDDNPVSLPGGSSHRGRQRRRNWWIMLVPFVTKLFEL